jgi:YYY domain-containing protein
MQTMTSDKSSLWEPTTLPMPSLGSIRDRAPVLILLAILALATALRVTGLVWDDNSHIHPDERFLTMVETSIQPPGSLGEYFNTDESTFNPHNVGHGFFVYGTFPIFLVRIVGELLTKTGYDEIQLVGRAVSALFDVVSVYLIFLIAMRLYRRRVALLAALFASLSVLLIQHSHFFVVDPMANTFILTGLYFAIRVYDTGRLSDYLIFGVSLGLSVASKISAAPLAGMVALAAFARLLQTREEDRRRQILLTAGYLFAAAVLSVLIFRVFQPYAFQGPSFFDVGINPKWQANMSEIQSMNRGDTDAPYALQWANRPPILFSLKNLVLWGLGLPLGIVAWLAWGWALWESVRGKWQRHFIPVVWTGAHFIWQSIGFTPSMRYQMPIYPTLALMAAWGLWHAWDRAKEVREEWRRYAQIGVGVVAGITTLWTAVWALAFTGIYTRPVTRVAATRWIYSHIPAAVNIMVDIEDDQFLEPVAVTLDLHLTSDEPYIALFESHFNGTAEGILFPYVSDITDGTDGSRSLHVELMFDPADETPISEATFTGSIAPGEETRLELPLDPPRRIEQGRRYFLRFTPSEGTVFKMRGSAIVTETTWDDGLPLRIEGYDMGGRYTSLNQELYWNDDLDENDNGVSDKLERITNTLDNGDYLIITSNRQYGTITRVPVRYPLTLAYYRELFDCPAPRDVIKCAARAQPGEIQIDIGYELIEVFESNPSIGPLEIPDQLAEEAFTVYDHPKVFIFKKSADFSADTVYNILEQVDLSRIQHLLPKEVGSAEAPTDLMLPEDRWEAQQSAGTWSDLFKRDSLLNRSPVLGIVVWWVAIGLLGIAVFPLTRIVFPGFRDGGYPLARVVGLLVLAWGSWMVGSLGIPVTSTTIALVLLVIVLFSAVLAWRDKEALIETLRARRREILITEVIALAFFVFDLIIRLANPDLWHPSFGGEKPMDLSYLNAVLKSTTFPPYDPWFAGGYINYYYFGFVIVGMPIKLLGIMPSIAYNLWIPTLFSLLALVGYGVGYNLVARFQERNDTGRFPNARLAGIAAALAIVVLGNMGTARMFYDGFKTIGTDPGTESQGSIVGLAQAVRGAGRFVTLKQEMPYPLHQWYWNPSRSIKPAAGEAGPITEFPFFTFLYADLHAHMINRPLTVMAIGWGLSWLLFALKREKLRPLDAAIALFVGGLTLGAMPPTNTWDFPVYWTLAPIAVVYAAWLRHRTFNLKTFLEAGLLSILLVGLAQFLFFPYHKWYGLGYGQADLWEGSHTSLIDYLTVHGHFLFIIFIWMIWESIQWMAETPLSALKKLQPYIGYLAAGFLMLVLTTALLIGKGYSIALIVAPVAFWAGMLILKPGMPVEKRVVLSLVGIGLALTFVVEVVVLVGDISRMNTVFKFYLQVWEMFSLAAAAALAWTLVAQPQWKMGWRRGWMIGLSLVTLAAALYPLTAAPAKMKDRMTDDAPRSIDGMTFMEYAQRFELNETISLAEDYQAIRWMQDHVVGTPVIVEANIPEYRWGSRFTVYTGLPGILGWNNHQRQQRVSGPPGKVEERSQAITNFYLTRSIDDAWTFLERYDVHYIVRGQIERVYYEDIHRCTAQESGGVVCNLSGWPWGMPQPNVPAAECAPLDNESDDASLICPTHGLEKFDEMVATGLLRVAYQVGETVIYEVVR